MKTAKLILFSLAISFCLACATSITDRKILGGQFEIGQNAPTALVPGDTYKVSVEFAIQGEDEPVNNVYWKELSIFNLGRKTILPGPFRIRMPDFDFSLLEDPLYVISLEVANNPFDPMIKKYDIRWALSDRFRFSGRSGKSSGWAERGTHGSPGPMIDVEVAYYDVTGTSLEGTGVYLLINVPQFDRYALVNQNQGPFRVESRGGQGVPERMVIITTPLATNRRSTVKMAGMDMTVVSVGLSISVTLAAQAIGEAFSISGSLVGRAVPVAKGAGETSWKLERA
jgi:hypothetical protein